MALETEPKTEKRRTTLSFGEVLWDLLPNARILGGAPFNFAWRMHELGARSLMISRLGRDALGQSAAAIIAQHEMSARLLQWDNEHATGTVHIQFDAAMVADISITQNVAYDYIVTTDALLAGAADADCICYGTVAQRGPISRETLQGLLDHAPGALKVYDINLRPNCYTTEIVAATLARSDVLKLNEDEVAVVARLFGLPSSSIPEFCSHIMRRWPIKHCLVTLGERGAFAASENGMRIYVPGYAVTLMDPLGAGDAFTAGFIHRLQSGDSVEAGMIFANKLAAIVATQQGATQPIGSEDIVRFSRAEVPRVSDRRLVDFKGKEEHYAARNNS